MTDRELHKRMVAMMQMHWRRIDPQWKDDPELCHAMGYEAGYNDAVARRVEPRSGESGAGFESLPASSSTWCDEPVAQMNYRKWQGLTDEEREQFRQWAHPDIIEAIELKLQERNT